MLKRFRTIAHLIENKNYKELQYELNTLNNIDSDDEEALAIIQDLNQSNWTDAMIRITDFIQKHQIVRHYEDSLVGTQTMISILETRLSVFQFKKAELERQILLFRQRSDEELNEIMGKLLKLRLMMLEKKKNENQKFFDDYKEAEFDYKKFFETHNEHHHKTIKNLNEDQKKEIQHLYRKASKLCHPDLVADELISLANDYFSELNDCYIAGNIDRIKQILSELENKTVHFFGQGQHVPLKENLEIKATKLNTEIKKLETEIRSIEKSYTWRSISEIKDWDAYFQKLKFRLNEEKEKLETELNNN